MGRVGEEGDDASSRLRSGGCRQCSSPSHPPAKQPPDCPPMSSLPAQDRGTAAAADGRCSGGTAHTAQPQSPRTATLQGRRCRPSAAGAGASQAQQSLQPRLYLAFPVRPGRARSCSCAVHLPGYQLSSAQLSCITSSPLPSIHSSDRAASPSPARSIAGSAAHAGQRCTCQQQLPDTRHHHQPRFSSLPLQPPSAFSHPLLPCRFNCALTPATASRVSLCALLYLPYPAPSLSLLLRSTPLRPLAGPPLLSSTGWWRSQRASGARGGHVGERPLFVTVAVAREQPLPWWPLLV